MKPFNTFPRTASALIVAIGLSACASQEPTRSGFLQDYEGIEKHEDADNRLEAWNDSVRWTEYDSIVLDPVTLHLPPSSTLDLSAAEKAALKSQATDMLAEAFGPAVRDGKSGQLRVRTAITGLDLSNPAINVVSALTLVAPLDNGGITVEIEVLDEQTREVMHRRVVAMNGRVYWFLDSFEKTGHARAALADIFETLAADLTDRCDCRRVQASVQAAGMEG